MTTTAGVYSPADWSAGPDAVYSLLAARVLDDGPGDVTGLRCIDLGAGTGVVSRHLVARGADVVAVDLSPTMLAWQRDTRPPAVAGDAARLPLHDACVDVVVSAFCYNHLVDMTAALRETRRVLRPGGTVLASTWPPGDDPVKIAAAQALRSHGWTPPEWYDDIRGAAGSSSAAALSRSLADAGLTAFVRAVTVTLDLPDEILVGWRAGVPHVARWLTTLDEAHRRAALADLADALRPPGQPWTVRMLVASGRRPA